MGCKDAIIDLHDPRARAKVDSIVLDPINTDTTSRLTANFENRMVQTLIELIPVPAKQDVL